MMDATTTPSSSRETVAFPRQVDLPPGLTPDHVCRELEEILRTRNVKVQFMFELLTTDGDHDQACIDGMSRRLNGLSVPAIAVTAEAGRRNAGFYLVTLTLKPSEA